MALNRVNPGFDTRDVLAARIRLTPARYPSGAQQQEFFRSVLASLAVRPGVVDPSLSIILPLSGSARVIAFDPRDIRPDFPDPVMVARLSAVSADYFAALSIPIRAGRSFTPEDRAGAPHVAIVNRRFARALWPDQSPIGRSFPVGLGPMRPPVTVTVVGVIDDVRTDALDQTESPAELYLPALQEAAVPQMWVVVRSRDGSPLKLTGAIRDAVRLADPEQPIGDIVSLGQLIGRQTAGRRFNTTLLGVFALLAVGLALVGIYGVTGYAVAQRHRELGIRMALGARPADVVRLLLGESLVRVAVGVLLGLAVAFAATRVLATMLFGVAASDAATYVGTALLLAGVALFATWLPARKATRVDPMVALRAE
jgi:predicted permease